jgi:hypothetical protein
MKRLRSSVCLFACIVIGIWHTYTTGMHDARCFRILVS